MKRLAMAVFVVSAMGFALLAIVFTVGAKFSN